MLRVFGPDCTAVPVDAGQLSALPAGAIWIDLLEPTREEEAAGREAGRPQHPDPRGTGRDRAVEPALSRARRVLFMTMSVLYGIIDGQPGSDPIGFILTDKHLVTVRYIDPKPFIVFAEHALRRAGAGAATR